MGDSFITLFGSFWPWLDYIGIAVFALSGALAATQERQTIITGIFFALATGVGGGTVRDLLIGSPIFWIEDYYVAPICVTMATFIWITPARWWKNARILDWFDAVGMAVFAVYGSAKASEHGIFWFNAMLMGVFTATIGGVLRDILAGRPSIIIRPEIYITAAALAASSYLLAISLYIPPLFATFIGITMGFGLRAIALISGLALPAYKKKNIPPS